jgi:cell division protein FtsB
MAPHTPPRSAVAGKPVARLERRVVVLIAGVLAVVGLAVGGSGVMRVMAMQRELALLESDLARLHAQTRALMDKVEKLRNDPHYIEKLAREDLGYVREGETVLKFPSPPR